MRRCPKRRRAGGGGLYERLGEQAVAGDYLLEGAADKRAGREARAARIDVRFVTVDARRSGRF